MTDKIYLKSEKFDELANELSKVKTDIQIMRATAELFPSMNRMGKDELPIHYYKAHQYLGLLFEKFQDIEEDLEGISSVLYAVTELNDLKNLVADEDINVPKIKG